SSSCFSVIYIPFSFIHVIHHPFNSSFPTRRSSDLAGIEAAVTAMINTTLHHMFLQEAENEFLEITYASGDKEVLYFKDFASGAKSEEHTSELQSRFDIVCRLLLENTQIYLLLVELR